MTLTVDKFGRDTVLDTYEIVFKQFEGGEQQLGALGGSRNSLAGNPLKNTGHTYRDSKGLDSSRTQDMLQQETLGTRLFLIRGRLSGGDLGRWFFASFIVGNHLPQKTCPGVRCRKPHYAEGSMGKA